MCRAFVWDQDLDERLLHFREQGYTFPRIAQILEWEVGINIIPSEQSRDLVLVSSFADRAALAAYQQHAEHQRVVGFLRKVHCGRVVVDYERP